MTMRPRGRLPAIAALWLATAAAPAAPGLPAPWNAAERQVILSLSPVPPPAHDATNRLSGDPPSIALGRALFFDTRLSRSGAISCATCHDQSTGWSGKVALSPRDDGRTQVRHAPGLLGAAHNRWFFWDGRRDTLWGQALEAMTSDMGCDPAHLEEALRDDRALYALAGPVPNPEALFVTAGKAIAAFVETLDNPTAPFDGYAAALKAGQPTGDFARIEAGLRVFLGKGKCITCHMGPRFTDGEFHSIRLPSPAGESAEDTGRFVGLYLLGTARYAAGGAFSDDRSGERARLTAIQARSRDTWGTFKTPSLRDARHRAFFMHDGRFASLQAVIDHYADTPGATSLLHGDVTEPPLKLTAQERSDLLAFLEAL